eukprot:764896-Hanusia_phi.AAC.2
MNTVPIMLEVMRTNAASDMERISGDGGAMKELVNSIMSRVEAHTEGVLKDLFAENRRQVSGMCQENCKMMLEMKEMMQNVGRNHPIAGGTSGERALGGTR